MTIIRHETYKQGVLIKCQEYDEWANDGAGELYEIDCSLSSPTREATPIPDWYQQPINDEATNNS